MKIGIIGLGYVGLPLAVEFSKFFRVVGFDINKKRILELKKNIDSTREVDLTERSLKNLIFSCDEYDIKECNVYIVTVPTPIDDFKNPNLNPLRNASILVGASNVQYIG